MAEETSSPTPAPATAAPPAKGGKLKKVVLGLLAVVAVVGAIGRAALPGIVKSQIETKGTAILGVPVTVGDIDLGVMSGSMDIESLVIGQPEGFGTDPLLSVDEVEVGISLSALMAGNITVQKVKTKKQRAYLVRNAKGEINYMVIAGNAEKNAPKTDDGSSTKSSEPEKEREIRLDRLNVKDYKVVMRDAEKGEFAVAYDEFTLKDIVIVPGSKNEAWFDIKLENFRITGPTGWNAGIPFEVAEMDFEGELNSMMAKNPHIRSIKVEKPIIRAEQRTDKTSNFAAIAEIAMAFKPADEGEASTDGGDAPSGGDSGDAPAPPAPYTLDGLEVTGGLLEMLLHGESGVETFAVKDVGLDIRDMAYPPVASKPGQITFRCAPLSDDSKFTAKLLGNVSVATEDDRDLAIDVLVERFPLDVLSKMSPGESGFKKGQIDTKVGGTLKGSKIDASAEFVGRDLQIESGKKGRDGKSGKGILGRISGTVNDTSLLALAKPGTNETVPVRFKFKMDYDKMSPTQRVTTIFSSISEAVMGALANAATLRAEALANDTIKAGGAVVGGAADAAGSVVGGAADAAGGVVGGAAESLGGLLGGGKKKDKEKKEEKKP